MAFRSVVPKMPSTSAPTDPGREEMPENPMVAARKPGKFVQRTRIIKNRPIPASDRGPRR